jgi:exonuclease SbcD
MKFIHTSDWHLGHKLQEYHRIHEHQAFLDWLLECIKAKQADALLISGDIFDSPHSPAEAIQLLYHFLSALHQEMPKLKVIMIAGNHDSAHRLEAPQALLEYVNVKVVGILPRDENRVLDVKHLYMPLYNDQNEVEAYVVALPYLRPADLPVIMPRPENALIEGVRQVYQEVLTHVQEICNPNQAVIVMGHCYMNKGKLSLESEKKILGGNLHALPNDIFGDDVTYVALGHLHLAQKLDDEGKIRYSGSPIPLSMAEKDYRHQVVYFETEGHQIKEIEDLYIPRFVDMIQIPTNGEQKLNSFEALKLIKQLPELDPNVEEWKRPYLKVEIHIDSAEPNLKNLVEEALKNKAARLTALRIKLNEIDKSTAKSLLETLTTVDENAPLDADGKPSSVNVHQTFHELNEETVFKLCWQRTYGQSVEIPNDILAYFNEICHEVFDENGYLSEDLDEKKQLKPKNKKLNQTPSSSNDPSENEN